MTLARVTVFCSSMMAVMGIMTVRVVAVSAVTMVTVMRRSEGGSECVPSEVGEDTVLDVATKIALLGQRVTVLLGIHSPSNHNQ